MRPNSPTYNKPVWATMSPGDAVPSGLVEIK
jgi:hypothetical protein